MLRKHVSGRQRHHTSIWEKFKKIENYVFEIFQQDFFAIIPRLPKYRGIVKLEIFNLLKILISE